MEKLSIHFNRSKIKGTVNIPGSKSISNRMLILEYLHGEPYSIENISDSDDTMLMSGLIKRIRESDSKEDVYLNCENAGTVIRFLSALLAFQDGIWILDGDDRMKHRPIASLIEVLRNSGVKIKCLQEEGYPPIRIEGNSRLIQKEGMVWEIEEAISSQFVSALMMTGTRFPNGVHIKMFRGKKVSFPYILMTAQVLRYCGVQVEFIDDSNIFVAKYPEKPENVFIEPDWTSLSYFYGILAISEGGELKIPNVKRDSIQGDQILIKWFRNWGIESIFEDKGLRLIKTENIRPNKIEIDFTYHPDLAQTMAIVCVGSGVEAFLSGLSILKYKETDRLEAMLTELKGLNAKVERIGEEGMHIYPSQLNFNRRVKTYNDHRMAMAFAMLSILNTIEIENPSVVSKSYRGYWDSLKDLGAELR